MIGLEMLGEQLVSHRSVHVGQSEIATLKAKGKSFVIDSEHVQNGGLQVVDVHWIFRDVHSEFVRSANAYPWLRPATGHPDREGVGVVVSSPSWAVIQISL